MRLFVIGSDNRGYKRPLRRAVCGEVGDGLLLDEIDLLIIDLTMMPFPNMERNLGTFGEPEDITEALTLCASFSHHRCRTFDNKSTLS
jgi:hypothetical protein